MNALQVDQQFQLAGSNNLTDYRETKQITEYKMNTTTTSKQQTLDFKDGTPQPAITLKNNMSAETTITATPDISLQEFFARPLLIKTITWTPGLAGFGDNFNPWSLFFGNKRNINRLNNYYLMSANLHVKFVINGNGFYYGRAIADYQPLPSYDSVASVSTSKVLCRTAATQRMHLQIDPTTSSGGEMILPFTWVADKLIITSAQWSLLGQMYVRELNLLQHANGATSPLEINVFAWAENVELSVAVPDNSSALVNQSGKDEYGADKFNDMATALSTSLTSLSQVPTIAPYAVASQLAVGAAANLVGKAGFSRPPDNDSNPYRRRILTNVANCDSHDGSLKLSVSSKQELSVGSESLNVSLEDELDLAKIASKQAYIGQAFWDLTHNVGDLLFSSEVSPNLFATELTTPTNFAVPPCMFAALPFTYWRGNVVFRFQVVASSYHRGRLQITWSPSTTASNELNVVHSVIMDLDGERDITVEIPWAQYTSWCKVKQPPVLTEKGWVSNAASWTSNATYSNGTIGVYVLNTLAVPNTTVTPSIGLNVYVSMKDAQFAVPTSVSMNQIIYQNQSGMVNQSGVDPDIEIPMPIEEEPDEHLETTGTPDTLYLTYMGERITSIRTLIKRYDYLDATVLTHAVAAKPYYHVVRHANFPYYRGVRSSGIFTGTNKCNGTFINYFTPAYLAQRGGIRSKFVLTVFSGKTVTYPWMVKRANTNTYSVTSTDVSTQLTSSETLSNSLIGGVMQKGADLTTSFQQPTLEVEFPFQREFRFATARDLGNFKTHTPVKDTHEHAILALTDATTTDKLILSRYVAAAEDFSLQWFQGAPTFYLQELSV